MACLGRCDVLCFAIAFLKFLWFFLFIAGRKRRCTTEGYLERNGVKSRSDRKNRAPVFL
jgi:hypothetical protein